MGIKLEDYKCALTSKVPSATTNRYKGCGAHGALYDIYIVYAGCK